jgi:hypothetical protein
MMSMQRPFGTAGFSALVILLAGPGLAGAQGIPATFCQLLIQEEDLELEEFELDLDLKRSEFAARVEIFEMIDELWKNRMIERMVHLKTEYERDSTRLEFEAADLAVERQKALIDHFRIVCGAGGSEGKQADEADSLRQSHRRYRKAHCDSLSKRVEAAAVDLEYNRQLLENNHELRAGQVAAATEVIRAKLTVEVEEIRLEDANRRVEACRNQLPGKAPDRPD